LPAVPTALGPDSTRPRGRALPRAALVWGLLSLLAALLFARGARADRPVIEGGREAEVVALFAPHKLGDTVAPGWRLMWIRVEADHIEAVAEDAGGEKATLFLHHRDFAPAGATLTASFALTRTPEGASAERGGAALEVMARAVAENDRGGFWRATGSGVENPGGGLMKAWVALRKLLTDGVVMSALTLALLLALVVRQLRGAPRWVAPALAGVVVGALVVRLLIAHPIALGAWPYSRLTQVFRRMYAGPVLGFVTEALGARLYMTDMVSAANLVFAAATPLAIFAHARYVLKDPAVALASAAIFAALPNHIRFSRSEVEFIPSLLLSSLTFAALHAALSDASRAFRWVCAIALPLLIAASMMTRELNALLVPLSLLVLAQAKGAEGAPPERARRVRAGLAGAVVVAGALAFVFDLLPRYSRQLSEGLSLQTVGTGLSSLVSVQTNTLLNPWITPPGLTLLAGFGAFLLWRARATRPHAAFLLAWIGLFYFAHAYVTPSQTAMQARYHLHLGPPVVMLAAPALLELMKRRRAIGVAAAAYLAASPLLHLSFERDIAYNDLREFAFVRGLRDRVEDGCSVLEYTGAGTGDRDARFGRIGAVLDGGAQRSRFNVVAVGAPPGGDPLRPEARAILAKPPACLVVYEGLLCFSEKEVGEPIAPACAAVREGLLLTPIAEESFESEVYDSNLAKGFGPDQGVLTLKLYEGGETRARPVSDFRRAWPALRTGRGAGRRGARRARGGRASR
jgi:hypothetical protein